MENKNFQYTYSAKEQEEVKKIREKYAPKEDPAEDKMEQLRALDASVTSKATAASLIFGVGGALILGTGMSLIMTDIAKALGALSLPIGIAAGLAGCVLVGLAYPIYNLVTKKEREKIAPEIIRLSDELMK